MTIEIEFVNGEVIPLNEMIDVTVGEPITLHVVSDADEVIHVHSDPEHTYEVAAGDDKTFTFTIETPGQVAVEAHQLDVTIVELVARPVNQLRDLGSGAARHRWRRGPTCRSR